MAKKAIYKVFNGSAFEDIYFKTSIEQVEGLQDALSNVVAEPAEHTHPINSIWTGSVYNIVNGLTPHIKSLFPMTKANKLAFLNPNAITIEGTDNGTTWTVLGYGPDRKVGLFSNKDAPIYFGNSLTSAPAGYTNNSKTRITIDQTLDGRYFGGWCNTVIEMSTNGAASPTVTIETQRKNVSGWHMIANKIPINGWSGLNDIGHYNMTFGSSFDGQDEKVRFTFEIGAVAEGSTYGRAQVMNISAYGDSMWSSVNNMSTTDNLYNYDYLQNAYFPNAVYANNDKKLATERYVEGALTEDPNLKLGTDSVNGSVNIGNLDSFGPAISINGTNDAVTIRGDWILEEASISGVLGTWRQVYSGSISSLSETAFSNISLNKTARYYNKPMMMEIKYGSDDNTYTNQIVTFNLGNNSSTTASKTLPKTVSITDFDGRYLKMISVNVYASNSTTKSLSVGHLKTLIGDFGSSGTLTWTTESSDNISVYIGKIWVMD